MAQASTERVIYNRAGQRVVSPDYLLFEAPRTKHFMTKVPKRSKRQSKGLRWMHPFLIL
jgi:hypothetical protein